MWSLPVSIHLQCDFKLFVFTTLLCVLGLLLRLYDSLVGKPQRLRSMLRKQGINGPPPTFLLGNIREIKKSISATEKPPSLSHDFASILFPFFKKWREQYGQVFMFCLGNIHILYVDQPDIVREITTCTSLELGKPSYLQKERGPLLGQGILTSNGTRWAHQRKILGPELYMEKVKVVKERMETGHDEKDLLQMVLEGADNSDLSQEATTDNFIIDNCKNIYLAGYETTAVAATWCLMLLASYPEWQDRVRAQTLEICGGRIPNYETLRKMNQS